MRTFVCPVLLGGVRLLPSCHLVCRRMSSPPTDAIEGGSDDDRLATSAAGQNIFELQQKEARERRPWDHFLVG